MIETTSIQSAPMISAGESIIPSATNAALMRRITDFPLPARPLEWDEEGTPIEGSVVYQYHPRSERFALWADIRTEEHLLDVRAQPERFELRTLFTASVEDLARSPLSLIAAAQKRLDLIEAAAGRAIAAMRTAMTTYGEKP